MHLRLEMDNGDGTKSFAQIERDPLALNDEIQDWLKGALISFGFHQNTVEKFFNQYEELGGEE